MKLLKRLPPDRTFEQVENHYLVEKAIAERLKSANREERRLIYATMYDELFRRVPDHPRLTRRSDEALTRVANRSKMSLLHEFLDTSSVFVEFAAGDCLFALEVASHVSTVHAADISDQMRRGESVPDNFTLIVYDGYQLDEIERNSVDLEFSDQFIEHLHPEEAPLHFELAYDILKPGGKYVFRTPHAFTGPHDVSQYFSDEPQGLHLKEWTYTELIQLLKELNFSRVNGIREAKGIQVRLPCIYFQMCERVLSLFPRRYERMFARHLVPEICIVATK